MIRKINISLILIAIICSAYITFTSNNNIVFILKDLSIILTINALYIIQKLFKIKISDCINFIYIVFIFMAHFLGVTVDLYTKIYWYDKFMHCVSGIMSSLGAIFILIKAKDKNSILFKILFIISFTMLVAGLWEIFEYLSSILVGVDPQRVNLTGVTDTMNDIIVALLGSILVAISYYFENKNKYELLINKFIKSVEIK